MSSSPVPGRRQRLGRLNQTFAYLNLVCNANSCDWIELGGPLDEALLERAIAHAVDRHPMTRSVLARSGPFMDWVHADQRLPLPLERRTLDTDDEQAVRRQLLQLAWEFRVLREDAHPLRFVLARTPTRHILLVVTTHVYTDGKSASLFSSDIAQAYGELQAGREPRWPVVDVPDRSHDRMFLARVSWPRRVMLVLSALGSFLHDLFTPAGSVALGSTDTTRTDLATIEVPDTLAGALRSRARAMGVSMHPFFLVATLRSLAAFNESRGRSLGRLRVVDNFSLRPFSDDPAMGALYDCIAAPYTLDLDAAQADEPLLRQLSQRLQQLKAGLILRELYRLRLYYWMALPLPKVLATRIASRVFTRADVICTNVGVLDPRLEHFGDTPIKSYYSFPQLFPPSKLMFQLSSFGGQLRLLLLYDGGQLDADAARSQLLLPFLDHLAALAAPGPSPQQAAGPAPVLGAGT